MQARMSSQRMPGKVLKDLHGKPMILRQIERIYQSQLIDKVVVATSDQHSDRMLKETLERAGVAVFTGSLDNVLERFLMCMDENPSTNIIRLTADCPLIDAGVIDQVISMHVSEEKDYTSNTINRTFPRGLDVECISTEALRRLGKMNLSPSEKEHVTLGIHNHKDSFTTCSVTDKNDFSHHRWTVDYPEDFEFVYQIYSLLYNKNPLFGREDIIQELRNNPGLTRLEEHIQ